MTERAKSTLQVPFGKNADFASVVGGIFLLTLLNLRLFPGPVPSFLGEHGPGP